MKIQPKTHIVTADEIRQIKSLGFDFLGLSTNEELFVNTYFPNCGLFSFLSKIDQALGLLTSSVVFKYIDLKDAEPPEIHIQYLSEDYHDENNGLVLLRIFTWQNGELVVKHSFFMLPKFSRGKGVAKLIFRASIEQYINMGVSKILVHAALQDGGYAWAKIFFTASNRNEIKKILDDAKIKLSDIQFRAIEKIYINYYTKHPAGDAFPIVKWAEMPFMKDILRGSSWHGMIDFNNQEQFTNFMSYVLQ